MTIYELVYNPYRLRNPYVRTLIDGIKKIDSSVSFVWGIDAFWTNKVFECQIIHIHWPEILLHKGKTYNEAMRRIENLKSHNIKIVVTCHNLHSHIRNEKKLDIYELVFNYADVIIHLGRYSKSILETKYPKATHVLSSHHIYDSIQTLYPSKQESLSKLKLEKGKRYIICFGEFRTDSERKLLDFVIKNLPSDIGLIVPGLSMIKSSRNPFKLICSLLNYFKMKIKYPRVYMSFFEIEDKNVPYYFKAADICLLQRVDILNSGNLPLALHMGTIVVGPNVGNVGPLLLDTGNLVFDPQNLSSVVDAINRALIMPIEKGEQNRIWALNNLSTDRISNQLYSTYKDLMKL